MNTVLVETIEGREDWQGITFHEDPLFLGGFLGAVVINHLASNADGLVTMIGTATESQLSFWDAVFNDVRRTASRSWSYSQVAQGLKAEHRPFVSFPVPYLIDEYVIVGEEVDLSELREMADADFDRFLECEFWRPSYQERFLSRATWTMKGSEVKKNCVEVLVRGYPIDNLLMNMGEELYDLLRNGISLEFRRI